MRRPCAKVDMSALVGAPSWPGGGNFDIGAPSPTERRGAVAHALPCANLSL